MKRSVLVLAIALLAVGAPPASAPAGAAPDPATAYAEAVVYGGTGCPQGSLAPTISDDGTTFSVTLNSLVAATGPGVPVTQSRKTCQLTVKVHLPLALVTALTVELVIPGKVSLPAGTTALVKSTAYVTGNLTQTSNSMSFSGPVAQDYRLVHTVRNFGLLTMGTTLGSCPELSLNFVTEVRITGPASSPAQLTADSVSGSLASGGVLALPC